jgi:hypothetical protein
MNDDEQRFLNSEAAELVTEKRAGSLVKFQNRSSNVRFLLTLPPIHEPLFES